jgi:uncharacterized protein
MPLPRPDRKTRRVLALDGGGIHGLFTLEVLAELERQLRAAHGGGRADYRLCESFDLVAGTSTGGIIAAMLAFGFPVSEVVELYLASSQHVFVKAPWYRRFQFKFSGDPISAKLRTLFVEQDGSPAKLGSDRLRTLLLVTMKNGTTGSAWPICNHPASKYNDRATRGDKSNLEIPLWQIVRASTAAPTFFPAQEIVVMGKPQEFIDGGTTPYNNPALVAANFALLPEYGIRFAPGEERLLLVSIGTGRREMRYGSGEIHDMSLLSHAKAVIQTLMDEVSVEQDTLCRVLGRCRFGAPIDREIGDLSALDSLAPRRFSYVRYNHTYSGEELESARREYGCEWALDAQALIPMIRAAGARYARENVRMEHFTGFLES